MPGVPSPAVSRDGDARDSVPFAYAPIRVVPRVERGEYVNVGVVIFSRSRRFLDLRVELDRHRLGAFAPDLDLDAVERHLAGLVRVCAGDPSAGPIARLPQADRFGWLVAPASTVVQPGPVHAGLTPDPAATLDRLVATMVRLPTDRGAADMNGGSNEAK